MQDGKEKLETLLAEILARGTLREGALSGARKQTPEGVRKVVVRPVLVRGERLYQFACHAARKVTHRNLPADAAKTEIVALLTETFRQAQFQTADADIQVLVNKKREMTLTTRPAAHAAPLELRHDRRKNYLLPEDVPCDFLIRLGVMGENGKVLAAKYDKFRQINRFLEMVADVADALPSDTPLRIVDFGCGKSYLTFALYHYLHAIRQREAQIVGLDLKADVVAHCNAIAADLGYTDLSFQVGDIKGYDGFDHVDMVVSLHACDTATDDALAKAVAWGAKVILSVPCCQHELFRKIQNETMRPLLKHGIFKERLSALITDALRANLLELEGYSVRVLEFIETEHTPKNLLLRAVKQDNPPNRERLTEEYQTFRDFWRITPYIEQEMGK